MNGPNQAGGRGHKPNLWVYLQVPLLPSPSPLCPGGAPAILHHVYTGRLRLPGPGGCLQLSSSFCSFVQPEFCPCGNPPTVVSFISFTTRNILTALLQDLYVCNSRAHEIIKLMTLTVAMSKINLIPRNALLASWLPPLPAVHSLAYQSPLHCTLSAAFFCPNLLCHRGRIPAEYCRMSPAVSPLEYCFWFHLFLV